VSELHNQAEVGNGHVILSMCSVYFEHKACNYANYTHGQVMLCRIM